MKKSFKERNPDVDMDEIQRNPNVPDDVKAAISGALTLTMEDEFESDGDDVVAPLPPTDGSDFLESYDNDFFMDLSDEELGGKKSRRKRYHENDEDWSATSNSRKSTRKKKKKKTRTKANENVTKPRTPKKATAKTAPATTEATSDCRKTESSPIQKVSQTNGNDRCGDEVCSGSKDHVASIVKSETFEKLDKSKIEPPVVKTPRKRSTEKEKTPKKISSLDTILATIETVVLGLDGTSKAFKMEHNPLNDFLIPKDELLDPDEYEAGISDFSDSSFRLEPKTELNNSYNGVTAAMMNVLSSPTLSSTSPGKLNP